MNSDCLETGVDPGPTPVSLILPCLNEVNYIEECLRSLLGGFQPPELMEVLVIDGLSTDGTRAILKKLNQEFPQIRIIDNPGASKPRALNIGISEARFNILMRIDAHAVYPPNYVCDLVKYLHVFEADNVGGVRLNRTRGTGPIAQGLAMVLTHPFGVGDAKHYTGGDKPFISDIAFLFCVHKSYLKRLEGLMNV